MVRPELLAPAGSFDAAIAAVSNGADAIYLGYGDFNARRSAKNFSREELLEVVSYCRARGVKTHVTLNTLVTDRELVELEEVVRFLNNIGVDALIVADLGAARLIRAIAPDMPIHASTQLTVHNIAGVRAAERAGFSRVVLARELDAASIRHICKEAKIEIEVFAHGALCMCYSGQCLMSSVIGQRSGNRGMCAQPCRLPYKVDDARTSTNPLSLKDLCLVDNLAELSSIGVASLKIEGRMKRPEYVAIVTGIYSQVLREGRVATAEEHARLREIFSRDGFTDAYYTGERDLMFGTRMEGDTEQLNAIYKAARVSYERETPRIPVSFCIDIRGGEAANLSAEDDAGNRVEISGPMPEPARTHALD
ncbi:MAG: peptidase U32 family protein, partial [Clostridia bacterium]